MFSHGISAAVLYTVGAIGILLACRAFWVLARSSSSDKAVRAAAENNWRNEQYAEYERQGDATETHRFTAVKGDQMNIRGWGFFGGVSLIVLACLALVGCPRYNVYAQEMAGRAKLAEAQSSRQVAILEAHAKMESAKELAQAEVIRAEGAAKANHILQNSLGGPEGYLRYLQIQAYGDTNAKVIYVPTEGGLPITEARRLPQAPGEQTETDQEGAK
jgi:hypothetical protein